MQLGENEDNPGHVMASCLQSGDKLGDQRSQDIEVSTIVWKANDSKTKRAQGRKQKGFEIDDGGQGKRRRNQGRQEKGRRHGSQEVPQVTESIWETGVGMNASAKDLGPHHRPTRKVRPKERQDLPVIKNRKGRSPSVCRQPA